MQVTLAQSGSEIVQVPPAEITWYNHISLITKIKDVKEGAFYIAETARNEWSRDVMPQIQIQSNLYSRSGKRSIIISNQTWPEAFLKDPYHFDFLRLAAKGQELEIENV